MRAMFATLAVALLVAGCSSQQAAPPPAAPASAAADVPVETPAPAPAALQRPTLPSTYASISSRTWALITKDPDKYVGRGYKLYACISQFDAATGPDGFRAQASYRVESYWYSDGKNAIFTGDEDKLADFVEGDVVSMNAVDGGSYSYDTQAGGNTTAPAFWVASIKRVSGSC